MKTRLSIDVPSGVVSRSFGGVAVPSTLVGQVTARDIYEMEVAFTAGEGNYITETVLPAGWVLKLGLRLNTSEGDPLGTSEPHTLREVTEGEGEAAKTFKVADCIWNLNTDKVVALVDTLPSTAKQTKVWFECEVSLPDSENPLGPPKIRQSLILQQWMMLCEVNMEGDEPPASAGQSAATAAAQAQLAAQQVGLAAQQVQLAADQVGLAQQKVAAAQSAANAAHDAQLAAESAAAAALGGAIPNSEKGIPNGVATLDAGGKVPTTQLPVITVLPAYTDPTFWMGV